MFTDETIYAYHKLADSLRSPEEIERQKEIGHYEALDYILKRMSLRKTPE